MAIPRSDQNLAVKFISVRACELSINICILIIIMPTILHPEKLGSESDFKIDKETAQPISHMSMCMCVNMCICAYACLCVWVYSYVYVYICVCVCVCVYVCNGLCNIILPLMSLPLLYIYCSFYYVIWHYFILCISYLSINFCPCNLIMIYSL